ncbi:MAG: class I mannose-6-phosphate isomerase [bacterium]|nr:class I mannose-6-phosphate isomerase [bacterium]
MTPFTPALLERQPVPKVWGGQRLSDELGIAMPAGETIGELWLLFDRPNGSTGLVGGGSVREWMERDPVALLGDGVAPGYGGTFPLMLKFIDARERLSLQVHPDDAQAGSERDGGKNEACLVLSAGRDAAVVRGLRPGVTREQFLTAANTAAVEPLLNVFRPEVGDVVDVPTGTLHSIGPDVLVFEVEQNSDVTYRLYDWGREREVQVDKALAVARTDGEPSERPVVAPRPLADGGRVLVDNAWFRMRRYEFDARRALPTNGRFVTLTVVGGAGTIHWSAATGADSMAVRPGDTVLVPACMSQVEIAPRADLGARLDVIACDPGTRA